MGIFSRSDPKDELMLVFHIGSSSVAAALFYAQKSGIPKIIFSKAAALPIEENLDAGKLMSSTIKALESVAGDALLSGLGAPARVFCVLSSPWYVSETRTISWKRNSQFVFTEKLADELTQKEIKLFGDEYLAKYQGSDEAVRPIELKNIKTMLNGYEARSPIGLKAKELEMIIFISVSGEKMLRSIEEAISRHFRFDTIKFSSFAMASFTVARDLYAKEKDFLLVDIGGEITEIFMTKKNTLGESISFPLGRNFLTRGVSKNLGSTLDEAASLISLWKDGHAEAGVAKKIGSAVGGLKALWLKSLEESLAHISKDISIPSSIYIIVDKDMVEFFRDIIRSEQFSQYTLTESKFDVTFLGPELLHELAEWKEETGREPSLIMDSIYINRFLTKTRR